MCLQGGHNDSMKIKKYRCQKCGSRNTQKCAAAYQQGVSTGYRGETSLSGIARLAAPPTAPAPSRFKLILAICLFVVPVLLLIAVVLFMLEDVSVVPAVPLLMSGYLLYLLLRSMKRRKHIAVLKQEYEQDLDLYQRLWICRDCGHIYEVLESN